MKKAEVGRQWIIRNSKGHLTKVAVLSVLCMISSAFGVLMALALKNVVDYAVSGSRKEFILAASATALLIVAQLLIGYIVRYLNERTGADIENTVKKNVWMKILTRDYGSLEKYHTGELMNRLSNDVKVVADNMVVMIPSMVSMLTRLICAMIILFLLDWRFAAVFLVGGIGVMGFSVLFRRKMKSLHKGMQEAEGKVRSFQQEILESIVVIRSFKAENKVGDMGDYLMQEHKKMRLKKNIFSNFSQTGFSLIMNAGYLFGIIWCGIGILNRTISYGTLMAVQQLIGQIQQPIANIAGFIPRYYAMIASAERLMELEELPEDDERENEGAEQELSNQIAGIQKIILSNVTTGYERGGETILENANLEIHSGDIMAVTGESGAGKSTFLKMLLCLYPIRQGSIGVTDENGTYHPLQKKIRHMFAYVPQGNFLISGSIRDVVSLYGMKGCMTVEEACRIACAREYIENLPEKYDTMLGERGVGLSEGQMQRLAIARAIYMGAPVLLLDEATSALDGNTEAQVLKNIRALEGKTVIIVTHRPAALDICNRRIEIKDKKIVI
ncbi:MAG: ABC transporter ATP-binding protein [Lachnospiraceae bacterium]|nr:ABC transporter ATP-binding protein [Lachnospiraceae bacterium]